LEKLIARYLPKIVVAPSFAAVLFFVYGFIGWTIWVSMTKSRILPKYDLVGLIQYDKLWATPRWLVAIENLGIFIFLFVAIALVVGLFLAILLDQKVRAEGFIRTTYLYPMALSFIVTGTAWKWILNPGLGIQKVVRDLGFPDFEFGWLVDPEMALYTIVIAGVWQSSGFVMALFLAGLRSVNQEIIKAAMVDGIGPFRIYTGIIIPSLRPVFISAIIVLVHLAIKSFDLVIALTSGGPGYSTDMPATYMYAMAFSRGQLGQASASATIMLMTVCIFIIPYLYSELRQKNA
jgi:glucose/mannose transport system permease protein